MVSEQVVQIPEAAKDPTPTRTAKALASKTNRVRRESREGRNRSKCLHSAYMGFYGYRGKCCKSLF